MRASHPSQPRVESLTCLPPQAAGLDIGSEEIGACVPTERAPQPVRSFGTFTPDLYAVADWLAACHVETVAREASGGYGIPISEILEARGFQVNRGNARHRKHVPGRKREEKECQWLQRLHTWGLWSGSFRPEAETGPREALQTLTSM